MRVTRPAGPTIQPEFGLPKSTLQWLRESRVDHESAFEDVRCLDTREVTNRFDGMNLYRSRTYGPRS